jgi:hypothetical protein
MAEDPGTEGLQQCQLDYLASLGTDPDELKRRYPHTYDAFAALTCDEVDVLDKMGAALAKDDPKGDHHHKSADEAEDAAPADAPAKLEKYLYAVH